MLATMLDTCDCSLILVFFLLRMTNSFNEAQVVLVMKVPRGLVMLTITFRDTFTQNSNCFRLQSGRD